MACRREKDTLRLVQQLHQTLKYAEETMPFELSVLEALLCETVEHFERHHKRLLLLSESIEREIGEVLKTSAGDLTRLLPIQKQVPVGSQVLKNNLMIAFWAQHQRMRKSRASSSYHFVQPDSNVSVCMYLIDNLLALSSSCTNSKL